jgi:RNA polymerase sigma factor (sigma-70 family)
MGTDVIPPRAGGLPARLVLGPALRAQSDGRLVRLVREGYEGAFEEIVRRYRRPLGRFAASIVGGHHEDVTQDSFRKALEALRGGDAEIELRPWLYRIVRNTALNDLRDRPPAAAELADELVAGTRSAAAEAEEREEVAELIERLRALPENQRAALLMRELDGMGHDEIAAALGISKGAARQAIARGRAAVRSGFGALLPFPLLRSLLDGAASTEAGVGAGALAGAGATAIGAGGAGALKIGLATVVVAGSLGAGVAIEHGGAGHGARQRTDVTAREAADRQRSIEPADAAEDRAAASREDVDEFSGGHGSSGRHGDGADDRGRGEDRGRGRDHREDGHDSEVGIAESSSGGGDDSGRGTSGPGPSRSGESSSGRASGDNHSGSSGGSGDGSGSSGRGGDSGTNSRGGDSGSSGGGGDSTSGGGHGGDSGSSGDRDSGSGGGQASGSGTGGGHGSGSGTSGGSPTPEASTSGGQSSSSSGGSGSSSGSSDSSDSDDSVTTVTSSSSGATSTAPTEPSAEPVEAVADSSGHGGGGGDSSGGSGSSDDS